MGILAEMPQSGLLRIKVVTNMNLRGMKFVFILPFEIAGVDYQDDMFISSKTDKISFSGCFACFLLDNGD